MSSLRDRIRQKLNNRLGNVPNDLTDAEKNAFKANSGTEDFHLHNDVTVAQGLENIDRVLISEESEPNNPNAHTTLGALKTFFRFLLSEVATEMTAPADDDRLLAADVSLNGNPNRWTRVDRIKSLFTRTESAMPTAANARRDALYRVVDSDDKVLAIRIKSNRNNPFFTVTVANLGDGHRGYAGAGYSTLEGGFDVDQGGSNEYSALGAASEHFFSFASPGFTRVGTYQIQSNPRGLATDETNLYYIRDTGSAMQIRGIDPETGSEIYSSGNFSPANNPMGLTYNTSNGLFYFYDVTDRRFYSFDKATETSDLNRLVQLSTAFTSSVRGLAFDGTNVYVVYAVTSTNRRIGRLNIATGAVTDSHQLTGFVAGSSTTPAAFTAIGSTLYVSTQEDDPGNPYLYEVNPNSGVLTEIGVIDPSNLDLEGFAELDNLIYAYHVNRGIYRNSSGMGNRWEVVFPVGTAGIDELQSLVLRVGENGTDIMLGRQNAITIAYVFANESDGASAHTISVGDSLEVSLHRRDGTQLFEGPLMASYQDVPLITPTFTTRGQLVATSSTLPTAADINELTSITWTLGSDPPDGFASSGYKLRVPQLKPSLAVNGFEAVALIDGVEVDQANFGWGPSSVALENQNDEEAYSTLQFGADQKIDITYEQDDANSYGELWIEGDSDILPSDATVRIYLSGIFVQ